MNTNKRPLLVMITMVLMFLSIFNEAKAQCTTVTNPVPIVIDYSGSCSISLRPTDFLSSLPPATDSTQFNITLVGFYTNEMNRKGVTANTANFSSINPARNACQSLPYTIIRTDNSVSPAACLSTTGTVIFRDLRPPSMSISAAINYTAEAGYIIKPSDLNFTINNAPGCPLGIVKVEIKRASEPDSRFRDTLLLSCTDPTKLNVVLKATNTCGITQCVSTELTIRDKNGPVFMPGNLPDTTVFCPAVKDVNFYRVPTFIEACSYTIVSKRIVQDSVTNSCGTGSFKIEYIAQDQFGNNSLPYLRKVTVVNPFPFNPNTIVWPKDTIINNPLITNPSQVPTSITGVPTWTNNGCELIATSLTEMVVRVSPTACSFKIMRKWSVANCCKMGGLGSLDTPYTKIQTIVVMDNLGPILTNLPSDQTVSSDMNCIKDVLNLQRPTATDCGNSVFPNSAFTVTFSPAPVGMVQDPANPFNFTRVPIGVYKVTYIVRDESNNISFHSFNLTVADRTMPSVVVFDRLAVPVGTVGTVMVNISSFIERASDNCTAVSDLTFSFSPTKDSTTVTYGCRDIRLCTPSLAYKEVTIYVTDKAGNRQAVIARVDVQKGMSPCSCSKSIAGAIETAGGTKVEDVIVTFDQNNTKTSTRTSNSGYYEFQTNTPASFTISPDKNDDLLNGVSTLDLVLISKHILGTQKFTSPYQHIAADIDKSGKISSADIVQLRKTLLGVSPTFGSNTSWRFVDKAFQFADPQNPDLSKLPQSKSGNSATNNDFIGVKVGDLNGNARANRTATPSGFRGSLPSLVFEAKNVSFLNKQEFSVPVCVPDFGDVIAYQFTMKFDATKLQLTGISNGDNGADVEYGTTHLDEGMATTSWMNISAMPMKKGERVFTLHFKSIGKGELSRCLQFGSDLTKAEAYNDAGDIGAISLLINNIRKENTKVKNTVLGSLQNAPNPFMERTTVQFYLEESSDATLTIIDQTGKLLRKIEGNYNSGLNNIEVSDLPAGLMFYRLDTPDGYSDTKRMLKLD